MFKQKRERRKNVMKLSSCGLVMNLQNFLYYSELKAFELIFF